MVEEPLFNTLTTIINYEYGMGKIHGVVMWFYNNAPSEELVEVHDYRREELKGLEQFFNKHYIEPLYKHIARTGYTHKFWEE